MTETVTIYHNPRCSKCRATLELLGENGIQPEIIEYLESPPDANTLATLLDMLGLEPRELMRTHEAEYREAKLDNPDLTREQLIAAMVEYPKLIERPIVVNNGKAAIGRPPQRILEIL
jgi:arsenate reductase